MKAKMNRMGHVTIGNMYLQTEDDIVALLESLPPQEAEALLSGMECELPDIIADSYTD